MDFNPVALATMRQLAGYSQAGLAKVSGVSQGHISKIEAGERQPNPAIIKKLADALGVPIASLASVRVNPKAEAAVGL